MIDCNVSWLMGLSNVTTSGLPMNIFILALGARRDTDGNVGDR